MASKNNVPPEQLTLFETARPAPKVTVVKKSEKVGQESPPPPPAPKKKGQSWIAITAEKYNE